jgi:hypothetical protein
VAREATGLAEDLVEHGGGGAGNSTYPGGSVNSTLAGDWWAWYMGAVNNAHQWEIAAHRAGAWDGCIMLVTPGRGVCPSILSSRIANLLRLSTVPGTSGDFTANIAADWPSMIAACATATNTVLDISSVGNNDDSDGGNDVTGDGDQSLTLAEADPAVSGWSGVRWLAYLAGQNGGIKCCGESVGDSGASVGARGRSRRRSPA